MDLLGILDDRGCGLGNSRSFCAKLYLLGLCDWRGFGGPNSVIGGSAISLSLPMTFLVFAVVSLISWIALRQLLGVRRGQVKVWDEDIND